MDLTGIGSVADVLGKVFDKVSAFIPDPQQRAAAQQAVMELQQAKEFKQMDVALQAAAQQTDINKTEAASPNVFIAGWRPFIGWISGLGFLYSVIIEPLMRFVCTVGFHYAGTYPVIDTDLTRQVMWGMLGFGAYRTIDKLLGQANGH